jgi:hypothetical protein
MMLDKVIPFAIEDEWDLLLKVLNASLRPRRTGMFGRQSFLFRRSRN